METLGSELLSAVAESDKEEVHAILQSIPSQQRDTLLRFKDSDRWNSLHVAANNGDSDILEILLQDMKSSACLFATSRQGETALHLACGVGHPQIAHMLLKPSDLDVQSLLALENKRGETALHCAAHSGADEIISMLVSISQRQLRAHAENGGTPLHYAAAEGNAQTVLTLLQVRADPAAVDYKGRTFEDVAHPDVRMILPSIREGEASKSLTTSGDSQLRKVAELGNERLAVDDYAGAKRAFSLLLGLCSGSDDFDEIVTKMERKDEDTEPSDLDDAGNRMQPSRGGLDAPKSYEEMITEAYAIFRVKKDNLFSDFAQISCASLGRCHFHLREFRACIASCTAALRIMPECVDAFRYRGLAHLELEEYEHAERDLFHASSLAPNDVAVKSCIAQIKPKLRHGRSREVAVARRMLEISNDVGEHELKTSSRGQKASGYVNASEIEPVTWEVMD